MVRFSLIENEWKHENKTFLIIKLPITTPETTSTINEKLDVFFFRRKTFCLKPDGIIHFPFWFGYDSVLRVWNEKKVEKRECAVHMCRTILKIRKLFTHRENSVEANFRLSDVLFQWQFEAYTERFNVNEQERNRHTGKRF